jgi:chromosome segregation ATPase
MSAFVRGVIEGKIAKGEKVIPSEKGIPMANCRPVSDFESALNEDNIKLREKTQKQKNELVQLQKKISDKNKVLLKHRKLIKRANTSYDTYLREVKRLHSEINQLQKHADKHADDCKDIHAAGTNLLHMTMKTLLQKRKKEIKEQQRKIENQKKLINSLQLQLLGHNAQMTLIATQVQKIQTMLGKNKPARFVTHAATKKDNEW